MGFKITPEDKKTYIAILLLALFWCGVYAWWKVEFPSATWRYKMTVTVETPEGLKTGSTVREVHVTTGPEIFPEASPIHYKVNGEAVIVDLGSNRTLFYTMGTDDAFLVLKCAYGVDVYSFEGIEYYSHLKGNLVSLKDKKCLASQFVTFKDIRDPKTVELVYGGQFDTEQQKTILIDNFERVLGNRYKLKDVTLEMTDELGTKKLNQILTKEFNDNFQKWWKSLQPKEKMQKASFFYLK